MCMGVNESRGDYHAVSIQSAHAGVGAELAHRDYGVPLYRHVAVIPRSTRSVDYLPAGDDQVVLSCLTKEHMPESEGRENDQIQRPGSWFSHPAAGKDFVTVEFIAHRQRVYRING